MIINTQASDDVNHFDAHDLDHIVGKECASVEATDSMNVNHELLWESAVQLDDDGIHVTHDLDLLKLYADAATICNAVVRSAKVLFHLKPISMGADRARLVSEPLGRRLLVWTQRASRTLEILRETTNVEFELEADPWARLLLSFDVASLPSSSREGRHAEVRGWATHLNHEVDRLRQTGRSALFLKEIEQRKRHSRDSGSSLRAYLQALSRQYAKLLVLRIDFGYRYEPSSQALGPRVSPSTVQAHRAALIEYYQKQFAGVELGYISKTEFGLCKGPHLHTVFILDGSKVRSDISIAAMLGEHWRRVVTAGAGTYFNCNRIKTRYLSSGIGLVDYRSPKDWAGAEVMIDYITKVDYMVRVWAAGYRTLVKGRMPSADGVKTGRPRTKVYDLSGFDQLASPAAMQ